MSPDEAVEAAMFAFANAPYLATNQEQMTLALEAAAPYMHATISTAEDLDKLWLGSVVLSEGIAYQRYGNEDWSGDGTSCATHAVPLPATVLHATNPYRSQP